MNLFLGSAQPETATSLKPAVGAQYPTPVPEDLYVGSGLVGGILVPFQNSYCQATNMFSACYNRELDVFGDSPIGTGRDAPLFNPRSPYSYAQPHILAYPSPSTASDTNLEDIATPSDTAFVSPAMEANNYPSHHHLASLEPHGDFDTCVDPAVISTAHSPQNEGRTMADDAPPAQVDGRSRLYTEDVGAGVVPRHQSTMGSTSHMEDVVDARSPLSPTLDLGRHMTYDVYSGSQSARPQPLGTLLSAASFLSAQSQRLVGIPRMASQGSHKSNTGHGRCFKSDGERDKEAYPCLFQAAGCGKGFPGKNEWKRHVNTIHIRWEAWVCAEGDCASLEIGWDEDMTLGLPTFPCKGRVFNRKDLYMMHLGRRHGHVRPLGARADKKSLSADQERVAARACHGRIRLPRDMSVMTCSVMGCDESFGGSSVWDSFLEHVADHLKRAVESWQGAVTLGMGSWIDGSLTSFGVAAGFLYGDGAGGWKLRDPIWNPGQSRRKGGGKGGG
ncbi:hypothetical protein G6O67_004314 [Ophiocordyceps sinensis]|uniref:C2H2-type domain-containing protein n=2 Tax=Ophiocordyceps sinensis TaxID=72228 RepID=A0A8H4PMQ8_9HYPO|nr:hypothetical protein OCS_02454 [Ophiocordyceps sinensis CO18]KAF4507862.1 hypothetical protein G6O67_004314 [Ophiocordyceps sinensis]